MTTTAFKLAATDGLPPIPPDITQSARELRATCGPVSLAALFGTSVLEVMRFFPEFPQRDFVTEADMAYALRCCGAQVASRNSGMMPQNGVSLIQIEGDFTRPGTPIRVQLRYTHWIACRTGFVFDQNVGDWLETEEWTSRGARSWMAAVPGYSGFSTRVGFSIKPQQFDFSPYGRVPLRSAK